MLSKRTDTCIERGRCRGGGADH